MSDSIDRTGWQPPPPPMTPLDIYGIDDADVYHPPSRARYLQMSARLATLEARETELQALSSKHITEARMWKARHEALAKVFHRVCIDLPILCRLVGEEEAREDIEAMVQDAWGVAKRIDLLERDAWTQVAGLARQFVKDVKDHVDIPEQDGPTSHGLLMLWVKRFTAIIPE